MDKPIIVQDIKSDGRRRVLVQVKEGEAAEFAAIRNEDGLYDVFAVFFNEDGSQNIDVLQGRDLEKDEVRSLWEKFCRFYNIVG